MRDYFRAGYPALYVVSPEKGRVREELFRISRTLTRLGGGPNPRELVLWDMLVGCERITGEHGEKREPVGNDTADPIVAIQWAAGQEKKVIVLQDFHHFLRDAGVQCAFQRACAQGKSRFTTLVIVSAVRVIPAELEKILTVVDFDLPDAEMRGRILEVIARGRAELAPQLRAALLEASAGLTEAECENAFALSFATSGGLCSRFVMREKAAAVRRSGVLEFYEPEVSMTSVGGLETLKGWLNRRGRAFLPEARQFGLPEPKGILVTGIPGTGKSLTAKAASAVWGKPLLRLDVGSVFGSLVGESEANMRAALKTAEAIAPCILWVDEIEKAFAGSGVGGSLDSGTSARVFGSFLTWMQEKRSPVFVFATANDISSLPAELLRKGRFDEIFFVDLPTEAEREEIFRIHITGRSRQATGFDLSGLARKTREWTGAEIEAAVVEALYAAFEDGAELSQAGLDGAVSQTVPLAHTMSERIKALREWAKGRARTASVPQNELAEENRAL